MKWNWAFEQKYNRKNGGGEGKRITVNINTLVQWFAIMTEYADPCMCSMYWIPWIRNKFWCWARKCLVTYKKGWEAADVARKSRLKSKTNNQSITLASFSFEYRPRQPCYLNPCVVHHRVVGALRKPSRNQPPQPSNLRATSAVVQVISLYQEFCPVWESH